MVGNLWRIAALQGHRLTASRFNWFAACSGAPSHCLPRGSGQGIVVVYQFSTLEVVGLWLQAQVVERPQKLIQGGAVEAYWVESVTSLMQDLT